MGETRNYARFREFVAKFAKLIDAHPDEPSILDHGGRLLQSLVTVDDWLPDECARSHPQHYQQYLLYCDPLERFSVVSFVWGPGQQTPVHDHTVWGLVGVLRGEERACRFGRAATGALNPLGEWETLRPGTVDRLSPAMGDIHQVANGAADHASISIHVYGANIGATRRHVFDLTSGASKPFVSGYSSPSVPNFWDYSSAVRRNLQSSN